MLPLHIFEPRYRQMTAEALAGDHLIALVLLKPGWEADYEGRPPLHAMACIGRIVADQRLEDGRYNLLLRGLCRARLLGEIEDDKLFRSARMEPCFDEPMTAPQHEQHLREELARLVPGWLEAVGVAGQPLARLFQGELPLGIVSDVLSFALPLDMEFKQLLLEELDVERRARRLIEYLTTQAPPKAAPAGERKFPPEFSSN
jgi:Lon protease-like protein